MVGIGEYGIGEFGVAKFGVSSEFGTITLNSDTMVVYNKSLELYKNSYNILQNNFAFKKRVVYRRYVFGEDNLSGDKNYANYNDYNIYAEIQIEGELRNMTDQGYLVESYGYIYLPSIISVDIEGNGLPSFRPQVKDEFYYNGNWYVIQNATPNQLANNPMSMECLFKIISVGENPR
ncbi:MAG: hypothetical protein EOL97_12895 [Spirochaetia bacterium]|nr:hypothetical protein [Spirochaetia bacterium]